MKGLLFICLLLACFWGCKKSDVTLSPIEVQVSLVDSLTPINISAIDITQNNGGILSVILRNSNTVYTTAIVHPGDQINIAYSTPFAPAMPHDNDATITYFYRGQKIGGTSGSLGYPDTLHTTLIVPVN